MRAGGGSLPSASRLPRQPVKRIDEVMQRPFRVAKLEISSPAEYRDRMTIDHVKRVLAPVRQIVHSLSVNRPQAANIFLGRFVIRRLPVVDNLKWVGACLHIRQNAVTEPR